MIGARALGRPDDHFTPEWTGHLERNIRLSRLIHGEPVEISCTPCHVFRYIVVMSAPMERLSMRSNGSVTSSTLVQSSRVYSALWFAMYSHPRSNESGLLTEISEDGKLWMI